MLAPGRDGKGLRAVVRATRSREIEFTAREHGI
jgi:hypothetical protein